MRKIQFLLFISICTLAFYSCERTTISDIKSETLTLLQDGRWELYQQQIDTTDGSKFVDTSTVNHVLTFNLDGETGTDSVFFFKTNETRIVNFNYNIEYYENSDQVFVRLYNGGRALKIGGGYTIISLDEEEMVLYQSRVKSGDTHIVTTRYFRKT